MKRPTAPTEPALVSQDSPKELRNFYLDLLFFEDLHGSEDRDIETRARGLALLAEQFLYFHESGRVYTAEDLQFDLYGIRLMLGRFQRDAYHLQRLEWELADLESAGRLNPETRTLVWEKITGLGLRISSTLPRKTRVAAAFSLWMATFRPISIVAKEGRDSKLTGRFCAALNLWIATSFLQKFGRIASVQTDSSRERYDRALHDFTFRGVSLSSLEMFYCGIFREHGE